MCTPKDVLDPSVDGQISYLCGRHDCSLLHFGDPVIGTVYDDRILVSSGQWWPLPRGPPTTSGTFALVGGSLYLLTVTWSLSWARSLSPMPGTFLRSSTLLNGPFC